MNVRSESVFRTLGRGASTTALVWACLLAGCAWGTKAPVDIVDTPRATARTESVAELPRQLEVSEPQAAALLDDRRLLARDPDGRLAQLAGVVLPDRAPRWLQGVLVDALAVRPFRAVSLPGSGLKADLRLVLRLQRLELDYRGAPQGTLALHALLADTRTGQALANRFFEVVEPVEGGGSEAGAEAVQRAAAALAESLAAWVEEAVRQAPAVQAPD